jgi:hypothetical protein
MKKERSTPNEETAPLADDHGPARHGRPSAASIEAAGIPLAYAIDTVYGVDGSTVEEAARAAYTPTGPSIPELEARIRALRAEAAKDAAEHEPAVD